MDREHGEDRFRTAGRTQHVARHGLGRADGQLVGVVAEGPFDALGLRHIPGRRRCAVCVDVVDGVGVELSVPEGGEHTVPGTFAVLRGCGHVVCVGVHSYPTDLRVDARPARLRPFVVFEDEDTGAVAEHEAVAVPVPGTARRLRVVVARRQRPRRREPAQPDGRGCHLGAARDHYVDIAVPNEACRLADVVGAGAAGRDDGVVGTFETVFDREVSGHHVDDVRRHEEGRDLAGSTLQVGVVAALYAGDAADTGADRHTDAGGVLFGDVEFRVLDRLATGGEPVMDELIHLPRVFLGDVLGDVETVDRSAEPYAEGFDVEVGNRLDSALSGQNVLPRFFHGVPHGGHHAESSYHNPSFRHAGLSSSLSDNRKQKAALRLRRRVRPRFESQKRISCAR